MIVALCRLEGESFSIDVAHFATVGIHERERSKTRRTISVNVVLVSRQGLDHGILGLNGAC